jgi:hypothetical protein
MIMRYHWGLAVGHTYANHTAGSSFAPASMESSSSDLPDHEDADTDLEGALAKDFHPIYPSMGMVEDEACNSDIDNPEFSIEDQEDVDLGYGEGSQSDGERDPSDDETFVAMEEMYGDEW